MNCDKDGVSLIPIGRTDGDTEETCIELYACPKCGRVFIETEEQRKEKEKDRY